MNLRPALIFLAFILLVSCSTHKLQDAEQLQVVNVDNVRELVNDLYGQSSYQARDRVVIVEQLIQKMESEQKGKLVAPFLGQYIQRFPEDPYNTYYLYLIGLQYEKLGEKELATIYFRSCLNSNADVIVQGDSVHLQSIQRLLEYPIEAIEKIDLYTELLNRFSDQIDRGESYYFLARSYEAAGQYSNAFNSYKQYLAYPNTVIPGKVNEEQRIRELLNLAGVTRDWTRQSLDQLLSEIRTALFQKDYEKLLSLQAKVNFFSMSWLQEKADFNSQVNYDLRRFVQSSDHIYYENKLEGNSNSQEAYLKTWGWSPYMPIWYLYFRRVNFPADPEIHGNWEWVGIYFGDSLQ